MTALRTVAKAAFVTADLLQPRLEGPRLLIFHQVGAGHGYQLDKRVDHFATHLDWLLETYVVVHLVDALAQPTGSDQVVLTFDDGFADMFEHAFPMLEDKRVPFTVYLTTNATETGEALFDRPNSAPLSWDQVNEMHASGLMTLGAHTHMHRDLRTMTPAELSADIEASDELIDARVGVRPQHFAYPWGYWSQQADSMIRQRYDTAVLGGTVRHSVAVDDHLMSRVPIQLSDSHAFFKRKVTRGQPTEERVRRLLGDYKGP